MKGRKQVGKKQRKFVHGIVAGKTEKQAALDAGYSESVAENTKMKLWSKPAVQEYFRRLMLAAAPPQRVVAKISEHIEGKYEKTVVERELGPADPVTGQPTVLSQKVKKETGTDAGVSLRALELAIEAAGYVPDKKSRDTTFDVMAGITVRIIHIGG